MTKSFVITIVIVAVVAFSASAFVFSDNNITLDLPVSTQPGDLDKQSVLNEIDRCEEQNLNGHMSVNSFNTNMLINLKQSVMNAETEQSLEEIRNTLYQVTDCKQDNSYYLPSVSYTHLTLPTIYSV